MPLKLHGDRRATCTKRVMVVAHELGIDLELVPIEGLSSIKSPEYLARQPFGQIPVLEFDNSTYLYESRAIARYLALAHDGAAKGLIPSSTDPKLIAKFEQGASVEAFDFDTWAGPIVAQRVHGPMFGKESDEALVASYIEKAGKALDGYERILSKQKYVAGDHLTIVDLFHLPYGAVLEGAQLGNLLTSSDRPHVADWWTRVSSLPSWKQTLDWAKAGQ